MLHVKRSERGFIWSSVPVVPGVRPAIEALGTCLLGGSNWRLENLEDILEKMLVLLAAGRTEVSCEVRGAPPKPGAALRVWPEWKVDLVEKFRGKGVVVVWWEREVGVSGAVVALG